MRNRSPNNQSNCKSHPGIVLLVTLVILVVLSILGYTLSSRVAAQRHRDQYIIDYQAARYGCDSAVKYALATLEMFAPQLISRPDEPDFSDLFRLSETEYKELLADWAAKNAADRLRSDDNLGVRNPNDVNTTMDVNDSNYLSEANDISAILDSNDPNSLTIRGPYGPPWPFVTKPAEFEIGSAKVKIEVEDENAKYPIGWALLTEAEVQREALAGLETFCEWMDVDSTHIESLKEQLKEINKIKPFKLELKPITITEKKEAETKTRPTRRRARRTLSRRLTKKTIPASVHTADFAKLFHSSLIDTEVLARPTIASESRKESALKYIGLWASRKVNINTAPRHVLEATFTFGGDADKIAEEIIQRRRIKPFTSIENLRKSLLKYSDSIEKCEKYITTVSSFFTIKVTAVSGVAKASAIIAITKDDKKIEKIAVVSG
jgi:hypothetical protein